MSALKLKSNRGYFHQRLISIATKHRKEVVMRPLLEGEPGLVCTVPPSLDTDVLGTFSGEVERRHDPVQTARMKCRMAMEQSGTRLAVASEGSFGPHPALFFVPAGEEIVLLCDDELKLEISARHLSTEVNFASREIESEQDLIQFASEVLFPSHAIILRRSKDDFKHLIKGITSETELLNAYAELKKTGENVFAETDMRALYNPTRMKQIGIATEKLVAKMQSLCPQCGLPGFSAASAKAGLPCEACGFPTRAIRSEVFCCQGCGYSLEKEFPLGKTVQDPMYCDHCNP